ncbi:hypothetical protein AVEN_186430-1 [Araneus ventricosus]|uniref:Peptidase aspartic putative domain-containing protein n=1 Tax=Araneus ventricosus TaxID=182803 RepID=A0A4Y2MXF6_ARAVE|nr:hypothetical protein AVEN_10149-1 [Araneus ventricosus]GBN31775.1 hypothetical protein AVEN_186430-1 [Araneus ventricosus]
MVVPKISSVTPSCNLDISKISLPKHIKLADPSFHKPAKISMLLGAQVFFKILKADQIKIYDSITLQNSVFNYIVTGGLPTADDKLHCFLLSEQEGLENLISKFWQLESMEDESLNLNSQTKFCDYHFLSNHRRDQKGHYIVQMAFLKEPSCLGESKQTAIRRLNSLWRKLEANPNRQQLYRNLFMNIWIWDIWNKCSKYRNRQLHITCRIMVFYVPIPNPHRLGLFSMRPVLLRLASR